MPLFRHALKEKAQKEKKPLDKTYPIYYLPHAHDGSTYTHVIVHGHEHVHILTEGTYHHTHPDLNPH